MSCEKKKGQKKNARRKAHFIFIKELRELHNLPGKVAGKGKKKIQNTDVSNHTEQIFKGSEMLRSSLVELFNSLKDTFKHFIIGKSKCQNILKLA